MLRPRQGHPRPRKLQRHSVYTVKHAYCERCARPLFAERPASLPGVARLELYPLQPTAMLAFNSRGYHTVIRTHEGPHLIFSDTHEVADTAAYELTCGHCGEHQSTRILHPLLRYFDFEGGE